MSAAVKVENRKYTVEEYFDLLEKLDGKYEYHEGRLVDWRMMAGATEPHVLIATNFLIAAGSRLRNTPCRVYGSDLLVRIAHKVKHRFPDVSIVCGETKFDPADGGRRLTVTNPTVLIEVLSESSERDDRGAKFAEYREIASLREYVLLSQTKPMAEVFRRNDDGTWGIFRVIEGLEAELELVSAKVKVLLREIYADVTFAAPSEDGED
jgi:Uma2 family endonuclease